MRGMARDVEIDFTRRMKGSDVIRPKILKSGDDHPAIRAALDALADTYGILDSDVVSIQVHGEVGKAITITPTLFLQSAPPEQLREQASRLLSIANQREQEQAAEQAPRFDLERESRTGPQA